MDVASVGRAAGPALLEPQVAAAGGAQGKGAERISPLCSCPFHPNHRKLASPDRHGYSTAGFTMP